MKSQKWIPFSLALSMSGVLVGCPQPGPSTEASKDTVKVGLIAQLSGIAPGLGKNMTNGTKLAVEHINAAGGVNGKNIELIIIDNEGKPDKAVQALKDLKAQGAVAAVGPLASPDAIAVINQT